MFSAVKPTQTPPSEGLCSRPYYLKTLIPCLGEFKLHLCRFSTNGADPREAGRCAWCSVVLLCTAGTRMSVPERPELEGGTGHSLLRAGAQGQLQLPGRGTGSPLPPLPVRSSSPGQSSSEVSAVFVSAPGLVSALITPIPFLPCAGTRLHGRKRRRSRRRWPG